MRRRTKVNKQLASDPSDTRRQKLCAEACDTERKLQKSYREEKSAMEHKAVSAIRKNSKYFFTYVKKHSKVFTGIRPLYDISDNRITSSFEMAEMLAEQYRSVFSTPKKELKTPDDFFIGNPHDDTTGHLFDIEFSEANIVKAIKEISPTAAAGPDRFPAILLKQCCTTLSKPLYIICPPVGSGTPAFRLGSRIDPHRHRGVVKVH